MNYSELNNNTICSVSVKCTYTEIYAYTDGNYELIFSVQKRDYPQELGLAIIDETNEAGLVPITINDELKEFLIDKTKGEQSTNYRLATLFNRCKDILYVRPIAIDCVASDEDVEIEDVVVDDMPEEKSYKWLLIAAATAALLV